MQPTPMNGKYQDTSCGNRVASTPHICPITTAHMAAIMALRKVVKINREDGKTSYQNHWVYVDKPKNILIAVHFPP